METLFSFEQRKIEYGKEVIDVAEKDDAQLEQQNDETQAAESQPKKSKLSKIILYIAVLFVLVGVSVGVTLFFIDGQSEENPPTEQTADAQENQPEGGQAAAENTQAKAVQLNTEAEFIPIGKPFVVAFPDEGNARHLLVEIILMTKQRDMKDKIAEHVPLLRSNLLLFFTGVEEPPLWTEKGRADLKAGALALVQQLIKDKIGEPGVDEVLFTSFVMQ